MSTALMQQFVAGLKSRHADVRMKTAKDLYLYVKTELREVSVEELVAFMDEFNHHIFEMVSGSDVNEKKGGILAIGKVLLQNYAGRFKFFFLKCYWRYLARLLEVLLQDRATSCIIKTRVISYSQS